MGDTGSLLASLECRACCSQVDASRPVGTCPTCGHTLFATYDITRLQPRTWRTRLGQRPASLWRYRELLPVRRPESVASLGEGFSPILSLSEAPAAPGCAWS